jgi:hypothetical protein
MGQSLVKADNLMDWLVESKSPVRADLNDIAIAEEMTDFLAINIANENIIDECTIERL